LRFEISDIDGLGRIGKLDINGKKMITPNLLPVVHPLRNLISPVELQKFGVQAIFTNSYIGYQNEKLRETLIEQGLHDYFNFNGLIATDSGAFQQYMYNNSDIDIKPAEIEHFQEKINSDFPVILDLPVQMEDTYEIAKMKVFKTLKRAKKNIKRRRNENCHWFGPIHGGKFPELLKKSSEEMSKLNFSVFAIGGLVKPLLEYRFNLVINILLNVKKHIILNRPIHMFGLGLPQFFSLAVACGCDLMDSAAYILYARESRYFSLSTGTKRLEDLNEFPCNCPICSKYTPEEIKSFKENKKIELLSKHNLYVSFSELKTIRQSIREGNLWELVSQRIHSHPELMKARENVINHLELFEFHEKRYKKHGRLITSYVDFYRPMIIRYLEKLKTSYHPPSSAKYLIILPELDISGLNSPSIKNWDQKINKFNKIDRKKIHIGFWSHLFGIIPLELISSYPMGQYEIFNTTTFNQNNYKISHFRTKKFFDFHKNQYLKCLFFIPERFINKFHEEKLFNGEILKKQVHSLKKRYENYFNIFADIDELLEFLYKIDENE
jgi:7-cyano-7-deazaguanine tRNA-ribosyltransferase